MAVIIRSWKDDPLEYLMRIKFPLESGYRASLTSMNLVRPPNRDDYLQRASDYRSELDKISRE